MSKEVKLSQISHKTYAVSTKHIHGAALTALFQVFKRHGARWNAALNQFEIPLQNATPMLKEVKAVEEKYYIRDVPLSQLRGILSQSGGEDGQKKVVYIAPKHKWNRICLLDSLLIRKYAFFSRFLAGNGKSNSPQPFKRVLLICWQLMLGSWNEVIDQQKLCSKEVDYQSLLPDQNYRIKILPLKEHEIQILTYQRMMEYTDLFTKKVMQKYTTVICDDSQVWLNAPLAIYRSNELAKVMQKLLAQRYSPEKDLILIMGTLPLLQSQVILQMGNILKPKQFGCDPLLSAKGEINDANWIKKRYSRQAKLFRELHYILSATVLINLSYNTSKDAPESQKNKSKNKKLDVLENRITVILDSFAVGKFKAIDQRFKNINRKAAIANFQNERTKGAYVYHEASKLEENRYLKEVRELMISEKMPAVTKYIFHVVKELQQRIAIVVENQWIFDRLEKFFTDQQISFQLYDINAQELTARGSGYSKFNSNSAVKVCVLIRDKLQNQYRRAQQQREKYIEMDMQRAAEEELGIAKGGLFELAMHHRDKMESPFTTRQPIKLRKITTVRHIFFLDTFWYDFSAEKEHIINNILDVQLQIYDENEANQTGRVSDGMVLNWQKYERKKKLQTVKHFFLCKDSYEKSLLEKYLLNQLAMDQEREPEEESEMPTLEEFVKQTLQQHSKKFEKKQRIVEVYDIDEEFDKLEFEALKEQEKLKNQPQDEKPVYNTHIEGLIAETPCLLDLPRQQKAAHQRSIFAKRGKLRIEDISWQSQDKEIEEKPNVVLEEEEEQEVSQQSEINLNKYIIQPKPVPLIQIEHPLPRAKEQKEKVKYQDGASDSFLDQDSLTINVRPKQQPKFDQPNLNIPKQGKPVWRQQPLMMKFGELNEQKFRHAPPNLKRAQMIPPVDVIDVQEFDFKPKSKRTQSSHTAPKVPSFGLWGTPFHQREKIIAPKYQTLKVKLIPLKSTLRAIYSP